MSTVEPTDGVFVASKSSVDSRAHDSSDPLTDGDRSPAAGQRGVGVYLAMLVAVGIGLVAGVYWHAPLAGLANMGGQDHAAEAGKAGTKQLWTCSMHPQVIKDEPGACPICHMALTPVKMEPASSAATNGAPAATERKVKYWWDPMMNPPYIAAKPGKSPMGMDLIAVYEDQVSGGTGVTIDPVIVQNMGVRIATVTTGPVTRDLRAVGYLEEAQSNVRDVNLRVSGWVEKLYADTVGMALSKGTPLFELYSPEVQVATGELIAARKSIESLGTESDPQAKKTSQGLFDATRSKLEQWGLDIGTIDRLAKMDQPPRTVTFSSPIDGYLTQKMLVQGSAVKSSDTVLRIVDLSTLWLDSQVYAQDLPHVKLGRTVTASVDGVPGKQFEGVVIFIQPELDPQTRTAIVRIALPNFELSLRPGMYATARLHVVVAERAVLVPREAIIDTGTRQIAFVAAGGGRFEPRQIKVGADGEDGIVQVLEGVAPGETVVTSGQFLLDAESRLREAIQKHLDQQLLAKGPASAKPAIAGVAPQTPPTTIASMSATQEHSAHSGNGPPATSPTAGLDRLFSAYLAVQKVLCAPQQTETPVDAAELIAATKALAEQNGAMLPKGLLESAVAFQGKPIAEQRKLFAPLSAGFIKLAQSHPPSSSVSAKLYVAFCPMGPGDGARWLQTSDQIANPYFATKMKECGTIEKAIATLKAGQP